MSERDVRAIQRFYPQIYFACHVDHVRAASNDLQLSSRDSGVLAHLDETRPTAPADLTRHLGVTASTLSALVDRLVDLGYVQRKRNDGDGRRRELLLTRRGAEAMAQSSVLDVGRVRKLLARLARRERRLAIDGMGLLARAAMRGGKR
jgi:DNA-binding MarR family transcriptional regulator